MAPNPDRELAEARAAIDRDDARAALKRLERARRGYLGRHDADGLEHLLLLADVIDARDEGTRIGRLNLVYAIKQNLRLESRRTAHALGSQWSDPYPALQAPTEHTGIALTRPVKLAIGFGVLVGAVVLGAFFVLPFIVASGSTTVAVRLVNDTPGEASVSGCSNLDCSSTWTHARLRHGSSTERDVAVDDLVEIFRFRRGAGHLCLPLRIHDAYLRYGSDPSVVLVARLSWATPCPGATVLPEKARETGL